MGALRTGRWNLAFRVFAAMLALGMGAGCASGGFVATRAVAKWLNSQNIAVRVLLYLFLWPVLLITMLADEIILNTIDFWSGKVSAQNRTFERDGARVQVAHSRTPFRRSVITIDVKNGDHTVVELRETESGSVEVYRNGAKLAEVNDIQSVMPVFRAYLDGGSLTSGQVLDLASLRDIESLPVAGGYSKVVAQLGLPVDGPAAQLACSK